MEEHLHDETEHPRRDYERLNSLPTNFETPSFRNTGDVVGAVFRLYRDHFLSLCKIIAVLAVPLIVAQHFLLNSLESPYPEIITGLSGVFVEALLSGALIYGVMIYLSTGAFPTLADAYRWGLKRWGRVLLCSLLFKLVTILGFMLLIIPGVIFSLMFALVIPVAVVENTPATQSFSRSSYLTKNYRWQIFVTYFLFGLIIIVVSLLTTFSFDDGTGREISLLYSLAQGLITQLLESSSTVLTLFIYLGILKDLRHLPPHVAGDPFAAPLRDD
ncbi:MAG TPA: hypothetical protein VF527_21660 [Pyrinomonadaceae bacterium]